jgi:hypothetical protein
MVCCKQITHMLQLMWVQLARADVQSNATSLKERRRLLQPGR